MKKHHLLVALLSLVILLTPRPSVMAQEATPPKDPEGVYRAAYAAQNAGDVEASMAFFAEGAVSIALPPPPDSNGVFIGKEAIRKGNMDFVARHPNIEFIDFHVNGETVSFTVLLAEDIFREFSVFPIKFSGVAVIQDGLIQSETWIMDKDSLARLDAAIALQTNKQIVQRFYNEVFNKGDMAVIDEIIAPDFIDHFSGQNGIDAFKATVTLFRTAFSDFKIEYTDMVAEGDIVVVNITVSGTYQGGLKDIFGIPDSAIGKEATWHGTDYARIVDGKYVEGWGTHDNLGWLQQLDMKLVPATQ
jgi:predicted ester cyclase